jgi:dolichol kinase
MHNETFWFLLPQVISIAILYLCQYVAGTLVLKRNLRVNYSRKIIHFSGFLAPVFVTAALPVRPTYNVPNFFWGSLVGFLSMAVLIRPIRERSKIVTRMFRGMDRPEDRPYTLKWLYTQMLGGYLVLMPVVLYFESKHATLLALIPVLINAIGDGLAEPVGVRWGKHRYRVRALFTEATYTRSLEGSACVFIAAILVLLMFHQSFTTTQFLILLAVVPVVATLAEALSPHTWDTPFIFLGVSIPLILVKAL